MLQPGGLNLDPDEEVDYSIAEEYHGPPFTYNLPRAFPIDMKQIPDASVVSPSSKPDKLCLPVVQPLVASHRKRTKQLKKLSSHYVVSPTSVISFQQSGGQDGGSSELSGESSNNSGSIVSPIGHQGVIDNSNEELCELSNETCRPTAGAQDDSDEIVELSDDVDHQDWGSIESGSETSSFKAEDYGNATPNHARREEPETKLTKQSCYRCHKGNRFTAKEACIVCNAIYCGNCVLRAMGSMPEGRKCISCIGYPVDESKRGSLGKCSRLLKRLLSELAIQQIMKAERLCQMNQLHAGHVYVNGQQISQEELVKLQSCPHPPTKLNPGRYWYDKVSGFWGQEGQKPCKIISHNLNIGGQIMRNASNGNTEVFINNREITRKELRLLKMAGVQCAGRPHFWLDECGQYQEEGQKNAKGNLWKDKVGIKLVCAALSLPTPPKVGIPSAEEVNNFVEGSGQDHFTKSSFRKLLLVGYDGSGTGTIFKQGKMLYKAEPFSKDERQDIKSIIQCNVYSYLGILLEGRERFEEESLAEAERKWLNNGRDVIESINGTDIPEEIAKEEFGMSIYSLGPRLKAFSDWLLQVMVLGNLDVIFPAANREYAPLVEELWKDAAIQATFNRRSELQMLPSVASHFLEQVVDISRTEYEPSDVDILYAEGLTSSNGLAFMDFSFPQSEQHDSVDVDDLHDSSLRYQLIRIPTKGLGGNFKWLEMFEDAGIVIFCVSLSDYDQFYDSGSGSPRNKMLASRKLFEDLITHPTSKSMNFHLMLNKFDLLEKKIEQVPLTQCDWFNDFNPITSRQSSNDRNSHNYVPSVAEQAFHYIAVQFKRLFNSLTGRKLHVSLVSGLESGSVDQALRYAREIVKWDEERPNIRVPDSNFSNTETSTYSCDDG